MFGDTVVVDDLEIARSMIGTVRMVTLDGDLVEKSGAMTGGFRNKSKLKFKASEEEKIRSLAEQITVAESERDQAVAKVDSVDGHIYYAEEGPLRAGVADDETVGPPGRAERADGPAGAQHPREGSGHQLAAGRAARPAGPDDPGRRT